MIPKECWVSIDVVLIAQVAFSNTIYLSKVDLIILTALFDRELVPDRSEHLTVFAVRRVIFNKPKSQFIDGKD